MLKDVGKCSTSAFLHTHGLYPIELERDKYALTAGIWIHEGLHKWIQGASADECMATIIGGYRPYSDKFMESDSAYHCDNIELIMGLWFEKNRLEDMPFTYINAEYPLRAKLADHEISTIPDVLVADKVDGSLHAIETKSTSKRLDVKFAMNKRIDPQFRQHLYICHANGFDVKSIILNAIKINKIPQRISKKCRICKIRQDQCWVNHIEFNRFPFTYSPTELLDWMKSTGVLLDKYKGIIYDDWRGALKPFSELHMIRQEGIAGDRCSFCGYRDFCGSGRTNMTLLGSKIVEREGIIRSGVV
jgi:hypothetical protein